ncbi:MAG: PLP-dependent aspartate aminotransferase family protein [Desulfuromonadales bacterium]
MTKKLRSATRLVHQGVDRDPATGAATVPVYLASTYHHEEGRPGQYDYARSGNPSRQQVEDAIALLEGGVRGFAYSSGMAAIGGALALLRSGDHLIAPDDLYGGSHRYLSTILPQQGIEVDMIDMTDLDLVEATIRPETRAIFLETPSNPLFKIIDIAAVASLARQRGLLTMIDNTFMTPLLQRPLDLGIDIVIHSATKFLGGHSDLLAGLVTTADEKIAERIYAFQNAFGCGLAPFDSFLLSRGIKTLKVRLEAAQAGTRILVERLLEHPAVSRVYYPDLADFPGRNLHLQQASGPGAVFSFELKERESVRKLLKTVRLPIIAPSLGGVETILTHCWSMSHAAVPVADKERLGLRETLVRISTGIEDPEDLWEDLESSLS